jgi:hypothetical protein
MATVEQMAAVSDAAEPKPDQEKLLIETPSPQKLPSLLVSLSDSELSKAVELGTAIKQFRERQTIHVLLAHIKRVAPTFQGQIVDFNLDPKFAKLWMKEAPESMDDITIPRVTQMDTSYPKDAQDVKALDTTMTEASNRLLCASTYLLDILQGMKDDADQQVVEGIFRSFCLISSATSMLEVERLLRPGDRPRVRDRLARIDIPSVIQDIRRSVPTVLDSTSRASGLDDMVPVKKKHSMEPLPERYTETFRQQTGRRYNRYARPGFATYGRGSYRGSDLRDSWARRSGGSGASSGSSSSSSGSPP